MDATRKSRIHFLFYEQQLRPITIFREDESLLREGVAFRSEDEPV
jgi:hypothetical protein